jgi:excinuclease ABC subunit A
MDEIPCPVCEGSRKKEAQFFKIDEQNITELCAMDISDLTAWFHDLDSRLSDKQQRIATEVIKEIKDRLNFLMNVGLEYLALPKLKITLWWRSTAHPSNTNWFWWWAFSIF